MCLTLWVDEKLKEYELYVTLPFFVAKPILITNLTLLCLQTHPHHHPNQSVVFHLYIYS